MTFELKQLGPYRIERTEDYDYAEASGKSYCEMIRVKGSVSDPPEFTTQSHLYKYGEDELGLYMKDKKNLWRPLGKLLDKEIDISDLETDFIFSVEMFPKVAEIVPFIRKKIRKTPLSHEERERISHLREKRKDIIEKNNPKLHPSIPSGDIIPPDMETEHERMITLDAFRGDA